MLQHRPIKKGCRNYRQKLYDWQVKFLAMQRECMKLKQELKELKNA